MEKSKILLVRGNPEERTVVPVSCEVAEKFCICVIEGNWGTLYDDGPSTSFGDIYEGNPEVGVIIIDWRAFRGVVHPNVAATIIDRLKELHPNIPILQTT